MRWPAQLFLVLCTITALSSGLTYSVSAQSGAVNAVVFVRPGCPHCHVVMTEVLPPLKQEYGDRLRVVELDTTTPAGNAAWNAALQAYDLARGDPPQTGVPTLLIGDTALVGSVEIPERFPALIEMYLADGGVAMPDLPGLDEPAADDPQEAGLWATVWGRYTRDLAGNVLSTLVLIALVATIIWVLRPRPWHTTWAQRTGALGMLVPIGLGLVAAVYLAYVETTGATAVCGPVGDCNTVQESRYALLFGFLPVAVLGVIGYIAILGGYVYANWIKGIGAEYVPALVFAMALFGLAFSTYLTFLEPFVIGATCAWCLTSAVCMIGVALASAGSGWTSLRLLSNAFGWRRQHS